MEISGIMLRKQDEIVVFLFIYFFLLFVLVSFMKGLMLIVLFRFFSGFLFNDSSCFWNF